MCWAKRSLTRLMQGLELCPWFSPDGAGVWSQQGLWDEQPPTVAVFRVLLPPPRSPLFAFSGATCAGSRSSGLRQQGRAGQLQGRSRERPQVLDVQAKLCRGSRWALESRLMLSPLPMVVTAQKPRRFTDLAGFRFWAAPKACRHHTPQPPRGVRYIKMISKRYEIKEAGKR